MKDINEADDMLETDCNDFRNGKNYHSRVLFVKIEIFQPLGCEAMINWLYSIRMRLRENELIE